MKTVVTLLAAASVLTAFAGDLKINGDFKGSTLNQISTAGWVKNQSEKVADHAVSKVVAGKKAGEFALSVKTTKKGVDFYTHATINVKKGDVIKMEADVTGKGPVTFAAYAYKITKVNGKDQHKYVTTINSLMNKTAVPGEVKGTVTVPATLDCTCVRLVFCVGANADVVISDVEAEFGK